ncbi:MAG: alpha/beta hydrolase-fold protein [Actinomycetaceae bacterium]|nr:alpha/beta hydrolase-fold protein [Actinomycetaceae bacterium]
MPVWFQPTAIPFLIFLAVMTLSVLGWAIVRLPLQRIDQPVTTRRKLRLVLSQALWVSLSCLCVLVMVIGVLNRANDWYPTWRSFTINVSTTSVDTHSTSPLQTLSAKMWEEYEPTHAQSSFHITKHLDVLKAGKKTKGTYIAVTIPSNKSGYRSNKTLIWIPPSYESHPKRHYPVLLALHGYPNGPQVYKDVLDIDTKLTTLVDEHAIRESIVVMPTVFPDNIDTECVDTADGSFNVETFLTQDVISWVRTHLRTAKDPHAWASFGYSAGGWCASMLSVRHPRLFPLSVNLSGYFSPDFSQGRLLENDDTSYELGPITQRQKESIKMFFWSAKDDRKSMKSLHEFLPHVAKPTVLTHSLIEAGGHSWPVWHRGSIEGLRWLGKHSSGFSWVR